MNRRRNHSANSFDSMVTSLKDYTVPIIGVFLVLILIWVFFFKGSGEQTVAPNANVSGVPVVLTEGVVAKVMDAKGKKQDYELGKDIYEGQTLMLKEGRAKVETGKYVFNINERGELAYNGGSKFTIENGDVWLDTMEPMNISMRYATVNVGANSHVSFTQNEVGSTVYLISGTAEVKNNAGNSTALAAQEQIEISRKETKNEEADLALVKEPLDEYFTKLDWFIINNGASYLVAENTEEESGSSEENEDIDSAPITVSPTVGNDFLTFGNLIDGSNVSAASINVYGNYSNETIGKITVNNSKEATINKEQKSFNIENLVTDSKVNDLVFKIYDTDGKEISRFVYTVFYPDAQTVSQKQSATQAQTTTTSKQTTFDANPADFVFTKPTIGTTYTTSEDFVTIRGTVSDKRVDKIVIRGHKLTSFNGSTWRYHAQPATKNLETGTNIYDVNYYSGDTLIYKNTYTIIKK